MVFCFTQGESSKQCDAEPSISRVMEFGYCKLVYESNK